MVEIKINLEDLITGDILLVSSKSWLAKKIQYFQKNVWNHAGLIIELWGEWYVCEAERRGICLTNLNDYLNSNKELMICRPKWSYDKKVMSNLALKHCGWTKYDYASLFFFQLVKQVTGKWAGKKGDAADNKFYCSEFCAYLYNQMNENIFKNWYEISPKDIFEDKTLLHFYLNKK